MAYFLYVALASGISITSRFFIVVVFKMAANSRFVELNKKTIQVDASKHFKLLMYLLVFLTCREIHCVLYLVSASAVLVRKLVFAIKTLIFIVIAYYCVPLEVHIINRTLHGSSKIWILCSRVKNNISLVRCCHW